LQAPRVRTVIATNKQSGVVTANLKMGLAVIFFARIVILAVDKFLLMFVLCPGVTLIFGSLLMKCKKAPL
jgi:hypothetical protein